MDQSVLLQMLVKFEEAALKIAQAIITEPNLKEGRQIGISFEESRPVWPRHQYDTKVTKRIYRKSADSPSGLTEVRCGNIITISDVPDMPETIQFFRLLQVRVAQLVLAGSHGKITIDGEPGIVISASMR